MQSAKATVLVIEDEEHILQMLKTVLASSGYRVIAAQTGAAARALIPSHMPDIILLDLGLPDMDGVTLLQALRKMTTASILVVSARALERDKVSALDCGADDYIVKPFSASELLARMRAALRRSVSPDGTDDAYAVGEFKIDFARRQVIVGGRRVHLTQIEYRIVELIARQPGKVLTYGYLIRHIWGPYADADNNRILRVNMSNIRGKIEKNKMMPQYILTEIGVGYRMAE